MPVIINSQEIHPFLPSLGSPLAIDRSQAEQQDIRPLEIAIINLMADKISTERQLALWLGNTMLQVNLSFVATDSYVRGVAAGRHTRNTPADHIRKFYSPFSEVSDKKFDGFIVTGVNALKDRVEQETFWPEVADILQWTTTNAFSCLFLCWGAKAALKFFHDIDSHKGKQKLFGLFEHRLLSDKTGLLFGFPDLFPAPVSRWKSPRREDILKVPALEIVADSEEAGPNMLVESEPLDDDSGLFPAGSTSSITRNTRRTRWASNIIATRPTIRPGRCRSTISPATIRRAPRPIYGATRRISTRTGSRPCTSRRPTIST